MLTGASQVPSVCCSFMTSGKRILDDTRVKVPSRSNTIRAFQCTKPLLYSHEHKEGAH